MLVMMRRVPLQQPSPRWSLLSLYSTIIEPIYSRPEQHGADMLGPLSDLLNACDDEKSAPAAALP